MEARIALSTLTVSNLNDSGLGSLRAAILGANAHPGADVIRFSPSARDGVIALTSGELTITDELRIDGPGASRLAVSGSGASRVFQVGAGAVASIDGLTISGGRAVAQGGGILNAGTLTLSDAIVSDNQVVGIPSAALNTVVDAFGGGIANTGSLTVNRTTFLHNQAIGTDGSSALIGTSALGGAIMSGGGIPAAPVTATVRYCTFLGNEAIGGAAGIGASRAGIGGAIMNAVGTFTVSDSVFDGNLAVGGIVGAAPGGFGAGSGGAIGNVARVGDAILTVRRSLLTNNRAVGGASISGLPAQDGRGGAIASFIFGGLAPPVSVTATVTIDQSTLLGNQAVGGAGTVGGSGRGGGIVNLNGGVLTMSNSLVTLNRASGSDGGNGQGGGLFNGGPSPVGTPSLTLSRSLFVLNHANGGSSSSLGVGLGQGGGLYVASGGLASADALTTLVANLASTSDDNVFGILSRPASAKRILSRA